MINPAIEETKRLLAHISIPPQPTVLRDLMKEQQQPNASLLRIAQLVSNDITVSARVLQTVNSPFYGLRSKVTSIQQAVSLLGMRNTVNIVSGIALRSSFGGTQQSPFVEKMMERGQHLAAICAFVARSLGAAQPDEAYTIGLFHDCGTLLLARRFTNYETVFSTGEEHPEIPIDEYEFSELKSNHALAGFVFCQNWKLPPFLADAVLMHHMNLPLPASAALQDPLSERLIAVLNAAQFIVMRTSHYPHFEQTWPHVQNGTLAVLKCTQDRLDMLCKEVTNLLQEGAQ